jgi:predicted transcriptional regulator
MVGAATVNNKKIDVTIDLPQDLKDIGFSELRIRDENGILKITDNLVNGDGRYVLFPFYMKNFDKSVENLSEKLINRKLDERIVKHACVKITQVLVEYNFSSANGSSSHSGGSSSSTAGSNNNNTDVIHPETQLLINEINALIEKYKDISYEIWQLERNKRYQFLMQTIKENIPDAWEPIEVVLTTKGVLVIRDITLPVIIFILGNPSTDKTFGITASRRYPGMIFRNNFNSKAWVSHSKEEEEVLRQRDLINKVQNKLLLIPEFAPVVYSREEVLMENLSLLTSLADGHGYISDSGLHSGRGADYDVMFAMVVALVELPYQAYKHLSMLGPKLYFDRMPFKQAKKQELIDDLTGKNWETRSKEVKDALFNYMKWLEVCPLMFDVPVINQNQNCNPNNDSNTPPPTTRRVIEWDKSKDNREAISFIADISLFLSVVRGNVYTFQTKNIGLGSSSSSSTNTGNNNDGGSQDNDDDDLELSSTMMRYEYGHSQPIIEKAKRANQVLYNIARGHAFEIHGRNYITLEDIPIIIKIAISTTNRDRVAIIKLLLTAMRRGDNSGEWEHKTKFFTNDLVQGLKISPSTARRAMMELELLGLVRLQNEKNANNNRRKYYIELDPAFKWLLGDEFQDLIKDFNWKQVIDEEEEKEEKKEGDNQDDKDAAATTTTTTADNNNSIHRKYPGSDIWECLKCKIYGDYFLIKNHVCNKSDKKNVK